MRTVILIYMGNVVIYRRRGAYLESTHNKEQKYPYGCFYGTEISAIQELLRAIKSLTSMGARITMIV